MLDKNRMRQHHLEVTYVLGRFMTEHFIRVYTAFDGDLTAAIVLERFAYAFEHPFPFYGGKPDLRLHAFDGDFEVGPTPFRPFPVGHGRWTVMGFRIYDLVYLTDAKVVPDSSIDVMRGAEVLVINGLRERPHPVHLSIPEALEIVAEVRPERAYLTHLSHDVGHAEWSARLPSGVELAYDGLTVELDDDR